MHTISFNYTNVFPAVILLCVYKYDVYGLAMFFCYNHRYCKAYNIYSYNTSLVFHLESSNCYCNCNCKYYKLYSTFGGKTLLGCFTRTFTVSAISNTRDYRSSTVSTVF